MKRKILRGFTSILMIFLGLGILGLSEYLVKEGPIKGTWATVTVGYSGLVLMIGCFVMAAVINFDIFWGDNK